jgi:hypothetical protein
MADIRREEEAKPLREVAHLLCSRRRGLTPLLRITQELETGVRTKQKQKYDEQQRVAAVIHATVLPFCRVHCSIVLTEEYKLLWWDATTSVCPNIQRQMLGWYVNDELERIWKEAIVA